MSDTTDTQDYTPGIVWGVKNSFRRYIYNLSDGRLQLSNGAEQRGSGMLFFPFEGLVQGESESELWIRCSGNAEYSAHFGMMVVPLNELSLFVEPQGAVLVTTEEDGAKVAIADVALGEPEVGEHGTVWAAAPVTLREAGVSYFGNTYEAGTEMDPIRVVLPPEGATA